MGIVAAAVAVAEADVVVVHYLQYLIHAVDGFVNELCVLLAAFEAIHDCNERADVLAIAQSVMIFEKFLYMFDGYLTVDHTNEHLVCKCSFATMNYVSAIGLILLVNLG